MRDLVSPNWMWVKVALFLAIGCASSLALLALAPDWHVLVLLLLTVWAFCRAYYFAFYVLEHYIDPLVSIFRAWIIAEPSAEPPAPLNFLAASACEAHHLPPMGAYPGRKQMRNRVKRAAKNDRIIIKTAETKKAAAEKK